MSLSCLWLANDEISANEWMLKVWHRAAGCELLQCSFLLTVHRLCSLFEHRIMFLTIDSLVLEFVGMRSESLPSYKNAGGCNEQLSVFALFHFPGFCYAGCGHDVTALGCVLWNARDGRANLETHWRGVVLFFQFNQCDVANWGLVA